MTVRVAINGFGRIGRNVLRAIIESGRTDIEVVAINDLGPVETNAHLMRYDSVHGKFPGTVTVDGDTINVGRGPIKVTAVRDPAQLPPVKGGGFFTEAEPDVMLTQVHRQAADNPIIRLSMLVREGQPLSRGVFGETRIISRAELDPTFVTGADQVLVGMNKTRRAYNGRLRQLRGFTGTMPQSGEKLVCLRNNRKKGLLNGALFTVKSAGGLRRGKVRMLVIPEEGEAGKFQRVAVIPQ